MIRRRTFLASALAVAGAAALPRKGSTAPLAPFPLFDTHAHFYTNQSDRYPFNATGARYGAERMIARAMANPMTPEAVFRLWDELGVEMGTGVQYNSTYGTDNSYLLDVSRQHSSRILPVVILPPTAPTTPGLLQQWARDNRLAGVRFTGSANDAGEFTFLSDAAGDAWAVANELGLSIVLMLLGQGIPQGLTQVARMAQRYPNVAIVLDHIAFPRPEVLPRTFGLTPEHRALAGLPNVYYKITSFLFSEMEANARAVGKPMVELRPFVHHVAELYGASHLVWGTDYGNVEVDPVEYARRAVEASEGLSAGDRQALFHDTARAIFVPGGRGRKRA